MTRLDRHDERGAQQQAKRGRPAKVVPPSSAVRLSSHRRVARLIRTISSSPARTPAQFESREDEPDAPVQAFPAMPDAACAQRLLRLSRNLSHGRHRFELDGAAQSASSAPSAVVGMRSSWVAADGHDRTYLDPREHSKAGLPRSLGMPKAAARTLAGEPRTAAATQTRRGASAGSPTMVLPPGSKVVVPVEPAKRRLHASKIRSATASAGALECVGDPLGWDADRVGELAGVQPHPLGALPRRHDAIRWPVVDPLWVASAVRRAELGNDPLVERMRPLQWIAAVDAARRRGRRIDHQRTFQRAGHGGLLAWFDRSTRVARPGRV